MGAGKSTIGRLLSTELDLPFYDSDKVIEERAGANIPWIFDVEGEVGFRERETQAIADLTAQDNIILATGGGAVLKPENRKYLSERGSVIYLKTSVELQIERTRRDKNRPLLQTEDPTRVLQKLMDIRDPLYMDVCDHVVTTDKRNPKLVVSEICRVLDI
ncbi:shikimate kinase [Litoribrevibacter albus]|uniref:Shikimate kinase n=2 Tax=Litoribrevibacter albus TaxID=1473156 RepID=A0AA37W9G7_9GAMM|nr:shikimate kinase [Litoribrevibacter albus]